MNTTIKNMLVGIFSLTALSLVVTVILFMKPTIGDGKQTIYVRFSDIGSLSVGTRVLFAGKPVGEVVALQEIENARNQPTDQLGRVYFYELTLHLDSSVTVYNTDEISIQSTGLLGEKSIGITPKAPPNGVTPTPIESHPVYADSVDTLQNALLDFSDLAANMEETFKQVSSWIRDHGEEVATTVRAAGAALEEFDQAIASVNATGLIHDIQHGTNEFSNTLTKIHYTIDELESKHTFENIGAVMASLEALSQDLEQGKGTLGKLMVDKDLYLQLNAIMTKANSLMNDLNHYGILFHLDKQWQRTRVQRMSSLNALESPQSFRNYFEREVDDINTSMARLSMTIEKASESPKKEQILKSREFQRDFAELMRKADELSENLRLYNQQLQDAAGN